MIIVYTQSQVSVIDTSLSLLTLKEVSHVIQKSNNATQDDLIQTPKLIIFPHQQNSHRLIN